MTVKIAGGSVREFLRALVRTALQEVLEAEMTEALGAEKGEGAAGRQAYRSGYYGRTLITQVGKLELRVPQDRTGRFSTELFERNQRSERALVAALAEMYVQGVSTRKVKAITEELGDAAPHRVALNNYLRHGSSPRPGDLTRVTLRIAPGTRRPNLIGDATTQYLEETMPTKTREKKGKANALQKPLQPSEELGGVVGSGPLPRGQVVSKMWEYIRSHNLQNPENRREILADEKLTKFFGKDKVTMFEMNKHLTRHLK